MEENTNDLDKRVKEFNGELIPLLGKYKLGLSATPIILSDGRLAAKPALFDDTKREKVEPQAETAEPVVVPVEEKVSDSGIAAAE